VSAESKHYKYTERNRGSILKVGFPRSMKIVVHKSTEWYAPAKDDISVLQGTNMPYSLEFTHLSNL